MSPDKKFQDFLTSNRPVAPNPPPGLREAMWEKIQSEPTDGFFRRPWFRVAAPVASLGFAALLVIFLQASPADDSRVAASIESSLDLAFLSDDNFSDEIDPLIVLADTM